LKINAERISAILADADFVRLVESIERDSTRTVMSLNATPDARDRALAEHHALQRLLAKMRAAAQTKDHTE
jgi:hypothetical protein